MYHITTDEMEYFFTLANTRNYTQAAKLLFVSQPTITKWIKRLENELGFPLFHRTSKYVSLTREGELLYRQWLPSWQSFQSAIDQAQSLANNIQVQLQIGALYGFAYDEYLSKILSVFEQKYPHVQTNISIFDFYSLERLFHSGQLDIIFTISDEFMQYSDSSCNVIGTEQLMIAMSQNHPLATKNILTQKDLEDQKFSIIDQHLSPKLYQTVICLLNNLQIHYSLEEVANQLSQRALIKNTNCLGLVNESFNSGNDTSIVLKPCEQLHYQLEKICCWHKHSTKYALKRFIQSYTNRNYIELQ